MRQIHQLEWSWLPVRRGNCPLARATLAACCLTAACIATGCAHHRADQYSYAPPYAPPVYSQPQVHIPAQPAAYAASGVPATVATASAMPMGSPPPGAVIAGAAADPGMVMPAGGAACPPCSAPGSEGVIVSGATMVEGGGQTPPCPPGP